MQRDVTSVSVGKSFSSSTPDRGGLKESKGVASWAKGHLSRVEKHSRELPEQLRKPLVVGILRTSAKKRLDVLNATTGKGIK